MATTDCRQFLDQLGDLSEGENVPGVSAHMAECPKCRGIVEDLRAIASVASKLDENSAGPPDHVWLAIRAQLKHEGIIQAEPLTEANPSRHGWRGWFVALPRPALAGAYLSLLVVAGFALSGPITKRVNDYRWMRGTQDSTSTLGAHLDSVAQATIASFASNPVVTDTLHKNLAIVDNYITLCEKSVREEPESETARDYLYDAYQQKADLLAQMNERGE